MSVRVVQLQVNSRGAKMARRWRIQIRIKFNYTCQMCHKFGKEAHHILPWDLYPEIRTEIFNGICLCDECHQSIKGKEELVAYGFLIQTMGAINR